MPLMKKRFEEQLKMKRGKMLVFWLTDLQPRTVSLQPTASVNSIVDW